MEANSVTLLSFERSNDWMMRQASSVHLKISTNSSVDMVHPMCENIGQSQRVYGTKNF